MYLRRRIDDVLETWRLTQDRKPLILKGARQTGKTTAVREFGRRFKLFLELNLEKRADLALVRSCTSAEDLLAALAARHNLSSFPPGTLLFFDEVQESPEAIQWLRFFREEHPEIAVIASGSLLEVRLEQRGLSFPVGRVTFRTLRPLSFLEFLRAQEKDVLVETLAAALGEERDIPPPIHELALTLLRDYLIVGGMPEAVSRWISTRRFEDVSQVHADLEEAWAEDFQKYRRAGDLQVLEAAFQNMRHHFGLRFSYENFAPGHRSLAMKTALGRLEGAMLMTRVWPSSSTTLPLRARPKSAPRLLALDVGLALHGMGLQAGSARAIPLERLMDGRLAELFVGQQLLAGSHPPVESLYFWVRETARSDAEVDYLLPGPVAPVPLVVKSGTPGTLKSLHQFLWRSGLRTGLRLWPHPKADQRLEVAFPDGPLGCRLISLPIYLAEEIWSLLPSL